MTRRRSFCNSNPRAAFGSYESDALEQQRRTPMLPTLRRRIIERNSQNGNWLPEKCSHKTTRIVIWVPTLMFGLIIRHKRKRPSTDRPAAHPINRGELFSLKSNPPGWHAACLFRDPRKTSLMLTTILHPGFWPMKWKIGILTLATFIAMC